jgi:hypothetical protein
VSIGCGPPLNPDCSDPRQVGDRRARPAQSSAAQRERDAAVEAMTARLGPHRRAEAERLVDLERRAAAARAKASGASGTPALMPAPINAATGAAPAHVARPPLPITRAPAGFTDGNRFVDVADPRDARAAFERFGGTCGGRIRYLTSACYPNGSGRYACQARVRCPLAGSTRARAQ